jgi:hypothetical protein
MGMAAVKGRRHAADGRDTQPGVAMTINGMPVQDNNADQFQHTMALMHQQNQMDANKYPGRK